MANEFPWIERIRNGGFTAPIGKLLGMTLVSVDAGQCSMSMVANETQRNPLGTLHGGVFCDLGDAAMGMAMLTTLPEGESFTTVELKINFFKPIWNEKLTAAAKVVRRTRSLGYVECDIADEKGSLVARLGSTCLVLRGEAAQGRSG